MSDTAAAAAQLTEGPPVPSTPDLTGEARKPILDTTGALTLPNTPHENPNRLPYHQSRHG